MKTLSIIVPTYNVEDYLPKCLNSLIVDRDDLEVLVIIDGSKDRSCEIALSYQKEYPSIFRVIEKDNGHYGSCVNKGLSIAQGKYVKVLDADDYFNEGFINYLDFLSKENVELVLTGYITVDEDDNVISKKEFDFEAGKEFPIRALLENSISMMRHYELTYRTEVLREISYHQTEGISYTDIEWSFLPFSKIASFIYYPGTLYRYLKGRSGQTVDIEYRRKNMWMENKVIIGLVKQYEKIKADVDGDNSILLKHFLSSLVRQVYFHYLINYPGVLDEAELKVFDTDLQQISVEIYQSVEDSVDIRKFGSFYYIRDFRKSGTRNTLKYRFFDLCVNTMKLINKIRKK